jgi:sugar/nucleoside kinase (ribokinase family)
MPPAKRVAVVACMDARLNPYGILGLAEGEAHVIRNAGGVVTDDVIRSLAISQRLLGTEEVVLIHHTDCGMLTFKDDDVKAQIEVTAGGQAANVAAWASSLGARATVIGPRGQATTALFVDDQLSAAGVGMIAIDVASTGTVVSIVSDKTRTLASDPGDASWINRLDAHRIPIDLEWLHLSGYPVWRSPDPRPVLGFVEAARRNGASISIDLASASMMTAYGVDAVWSVLEELAPRLVFANAAEWDACGLDWSDVPFDVVVKGGADGAVTVVGGVVMEHAAMLTDVVDLTGAGDALAAGYLVGGIQLGLSAAARCVSQHGAQPSDPAPRPGRHRSGHNAT